MKGMSQDERRGFNKYNSIILKHYKPLLTHMSSQIYAIENAKHVIICFGHQKNRGSISKNIAHTSSSSDRDGGGNTSD